MNQDFTLHPQLATDTHLLLDLKYSQVLLHKNATIPWIIIVPKTALTEFYELPSSTQELINAMIKNIASYFKAEYQTVKMNIAAIGNLVPQLHIHVIGRKPGDACWPDVVWGCEYFYKDYSEKCIDRLKLHLINGFNNK